MSDQFDRQLDRFIDHLNLERHVSPYTVRNYASDLQSLFSFLREKGVASPQEVDKHNLRQYLSKLYDEHIVKPSIARKQSAIRSFYRYLKREGDIKESPIPLTRKGGRLSAFSIKLERRLPSFLSVEETVHLLKAPDLSTAQGQRDRAIMELIYASGLRISELEKLNLEQVNFSTREIRVWGKGNKERVVLIGEPAAQYLSAYISQARRRLLGEKQGKAVFVNRYGERLTGRMVQKMLHKRAKEAGIKKEVHPHTLRHTFATHMLDGGADLRVVQELLGHSQLSSTQIYTHVTSSQARKVYLAAHPLAKKEEDNDRQADTDTPED